MTINIEELTQSLGHDFDALVAKGVIEETSPPSPEDEADIEPALYIEQGLTLIFDLTNHLRKIEFKVAGGSGEVFEKALPFGLYQSGMTQADVLEMNGGPTESESPKKLPVIGWNGGSDAFDSLSQTPRNSRIRYLYNADKAVRYIVISEKGYVPRDSV